jgi:nucleoside-diphosphate-sugar epimerase
MILVTGGAGYLGSLLVPELLSLGESVRVVDTFWFGCPFEPHQRLERIEADVRDCVPQWLDEVDAVVHLAGLSNDPTADFAPELNSECNVQATRRLARLVAEKAAQERRSIRFLFASSCSVYYTASHEDDVNVTPMTEDLPNAPTANYSKTKRLAEIDLLRLAERCPEFCPVLLRKGTLMGLAPRMRFDLVVNVFTLNAWRKRVLQVHGHGEVWRPLLHIRDAVDAYLHLLWAPEEKIRAQIFNIVHKNYRILELAHWVAELLEQYRGVPIQVRRDRSVDNSARSYYVLGDKITNALGFRPGRGVREAVLPIWDALERGEFGTEPENDARYFNIRWLKDKVMEKEHKLWGNDRLGANGAHVPEKVMV